MDEKVFFTDEQGNEVSLQVLDVFENGDKQFAIFIDPADGQAFLMRMDRAEEGYQFQPPTEEEMPAAVEKAMALLNERSTYDSGCGGSCHSCQGCGHAQEDDGEQ